MRKDIEKAKDRLVQTIKQSTGVDLTNKITISAYNPDNWTRYKIEDISDVGERHLTPNLTHKQMLIALDTCQNLIEKMIDIDHFNDSQYFLVFIEDRTIDIYIDPDKVYVDTDNGGMTFRSPVYPVVAWKEYNTEAEAENEAMKLYIEQWEFNVIELDQIPGIEY